MVHTYLYLFRELQNCDGKWLCCEKMDENGLPTPFKLQTVQENFKMLTAAGDLYIEDSIAEYVDCIGVSNESLPVKMYFEKQCGDGLSEWYDRGSLTLSDIDVCLDKMRNMLELTGYMPRCLISEDESEAINILYRYENGCYDKTESNKMRLYRRLFEINPVQRFYNEISNSSIYGEALDYCMNNIENFSNSDSYSIFSQLSKTIYFKNARVVFWYR